MCPQECGDKDSPWTGRLWGLHLWWPSCHSEGRAPLQMDPVQKKQEKVKEGWWGRQEERYKDRVWWLYLNPWLNHAWECPTRNLFRPISQASLFKVNLGLLSLKPRDWKALHHVVRLFQWNVQPHEEMPSIRGWHWVFSKGICIQFTKSERIIHLILFSSFMSFLTSGSHNSLTVLDAK